MRVPLPALVLICLSLAAPLALPSLAGAATVSVAPYSEPPTPGGGCAKTQTCPADMVVFTAAPGEANDVSIQATNGAPFRFLLREHGSTPLVPGRGCAPAGPNAVACDAETVGPVELGDDDDRVSSRSGRVAGGAGDDVLSVTNGDGGPGNDLVIGRRVVGGSGDDALWVSFLGTGGAGNDNIRCYPSFASCVLDGEAGNDRLTGGRDPDRLRGAAGSDRIRGGGGGDLLGGGAGNDLLEGGAGVDVMRGGSGADRIESRELVARGERVARDDVNCGSGRRDRALADRRDSVDRCEQITRRRRTR